MVYSAFPGQVLGRFYFACQFSLCFVPLRPALGRRKSCLFFERTGSAARRLAAAECTGRRSCINTSWCRSHPHQQPNFVNKLMYFTPFSQIFSCLYLSIVNDQVLHIFIFLVSVPIFICYYRYTNCVFKNSNLLTLVD